MWASCSTTEISTALHRALHSCDRLLCLTQCTCTSSGSNSSRSSSSSSSSGSNSSGRPMEALATLLEWIGSCEHHLRMLVRSCYVQHIALYCVPVTHTQHITYSSHLCTHLVLLCGLLLVNANASACASKYTHAHTYIAT